MNPQEIWDCICAIIHKISQARQEILATSGRIKNYVKDSAEDQDRAHE